MRLHLTLGGDFTGGHGHNISANVSNTSNYYGNNSYYTQSKENLQLSTYAQYYKDFNDLHHFDIMAGYEWQHNWRKEYNESWGTYPTNSSLFFTDEDSEKALHVTPGIWIPAANYKVGDPKAGAIYGDGIYQQNNGQGYRTENYLVSFFASNAEDPGLIPGSGRSPGKGNGNPLQYSCLENPMDVTLVGYSPQGRKESDTTKQLYFHFLLSESSGEVKVTQSCLTFCDPMDRSIPGFSVLGILQARILKWVAVPFSRGSSQPRGQTHVFRVAGRFFTI